MLKQFTTKPYVSLVYRDSIWPDDNDVPYKIISSKDPSWGVSSIFKKPRIFTSLDRLLKCLDEDLREFLKANEGEKIGGSNIRIFVSGSGEEFGDADLEFSMPKLSLNELRDIFDYDDKKFLNYLVYLDKQAGSSDYNSIDYFKDFYVHSFSFYYFLTTVIGNKTVYHVTYVKFSKVNE